MPTLSGLSKSSCTKSRAGVAKAWLTDCANISALTFDTDYQVSAITMVTSTIFYAYEFQKNTAFFTQEKTANGNSINVVQTLSFVHASLDNTARKELANLNDCCCLVAIIKDNSGRLHFAGITHDTSDGTWETEDMRTGTGSANTGTDPAADRAEYIETLTCNAGFYAPQTTVAESAIVVS